MTCHVNLAICTQHNIKVYCTECAEMADVDPEMLLEWLTLGQGEERDIQLLALEQLCMLLLMADNVDKCFEA